MTFDELDNSIRALENIDGVDSFILGYSTLGQEILGFHVGAYDGHQLIIEGGIHAREYPSSLVVVGITEYLAGQELNGGAYIIPLVNPDGARLVLDGVDWVNCSKLRQYIVDVNDGSLDFSMWKADILAVDLNVNFDALWGGGSQNVFCPSPANFVGYYANSEREVRQMIDFTYRVSPSLTLSFHTKGEVIYYGFETLSPEDIEGDRRIAEVISSINGYTPIKTESSTGGYSDWVSEYLGVPAFTIEVGASTLPTPIPLDVVPDAIERNRDVPIRMLELLNEE